MSLSKRSLCILVLLAAFALRVIELNTLPPGLHFDEAENVGRAWRLTQGYGLMPNFEGIPEPFDAHVRAAFLSFVGVTPFTARLFSGFLGLLAVAAVIAAARALFWRHPARETIALAAGVTLAAMPPFVVLNRAVYAVNWIPFTTTMAVAALVWAWRSNRLRYFALSGAFAGLAVMFYLAGIAFPVALAVVLVLLMIARRFRWPGRRGLALLVAAGLVVLLPWFYLHLRLPGWMTQRIDALTVRFDPVSEPGNLLVQVQRAVQPIFIPNTVVFPVYNPYTVAFLNPALAVLFAVGAVVAVSRWRKQPEGLVPLLVAGMMILPNLLSNRPEQPNRMAGIYAPLALLVGLGAGEVARFAGARGRAWLRMGVSLALAGIFIVTPAISWAAVRYHFLDEPRLWSDPTDVRQWAYLLHLGYEDFLKQIIHSPRPVYVPVDQLNTNTAVALLRPGAFPRVLPYDGRPLPPGDLLRPDKSITYGFPEVDGVPTQYALALPDTGEIVILPPLSPDTVQTLEAQIQREGAPLVTSQGWNMGKRLSIETFPLASAGQALQTASANQPLAVFDNRLELLSVDAPTELKPGETVPVTLYWRLREGTGEDYFVRLQAWDYSDTARGTQNDRDGLILRYLYPTVMWKPGQVVAERRWLQVYPDAPSGGYRFAISVSAYPGPAARGVAPVTGRAEAKDEWALVSGTAVNPGAFLGSKETPARTLDAGLGEAVRLTGATFSQPLSELKPGSTLDVRLYWQTIQPVSESYTLFVHLTDASGKLVAQQDAVPFDGQFPTWAWPPGQTVVTAHPLTLAADANGPYTLTVGMYRYPSLERLPAVQDGAPQPDGLLTLRPW
jgi:4-amino-4-deoxy-L-arabinose transferase-like glycosyltransferase